MEMDWKDIFSSDRLGTQTNTQDTDGRSEYQRDFDRIIFSSGFRRMQNKTQVFPLPGTTFVHNRLTHSLEVASVGRSLGKIVGSDIVKYFGNEFDENVKIFYSHELSNVIAAACLAHDIGNPPFGHSGEKAISDYFIGNQEIQKHFLNGDKYDPCWQEFLNFEGNANGLRYLTHSYNGKIKGGLRLTITTLAATLKYPCSLARRNATNIHTKKFNYFNSEHETFKKICDGTKMIKDGSSDEVYKRHPFVYLTEAADDICYRLIDIEDAQRLKIVDSHNIIPILQNLIKCLGIQDHSKVTKVSDAIMDENNRVSYLRAKCINALTILCAKAFIINSQAILKGSFNDDLLNFVIRNINCSELQTNESRSTEDTQCERDVFASLPKLLREKYTDIMSEDSTDKVLKTLINHNCSMPKGGESAQTGTAPRTIQEITKRQIYNHPKVVKIEVLGYKVLGDLLGLFIPAVLAKNPSSKEEKLREIIPKQFRCNYNINDSKERVFSVLDFLSGMTDEYALRLYRELTGMEIGSHS